MCVAILKKIDLLTMEILKKYTNCIDWWHISDVLAGYSRFWGKRKEDPFPPVFIQKYVNILRRLMAYTHILNMPKHQNGT
jgi:hypothetical protein